MTFERGNEEKWTVGEILSAMAGTEHPRYIQKIVTQLQQWMEESLTSEAAEHDGDPLSALFDSVLEADGEKLFTQLEWVDDYADLLPTLRNPQATRMPSCSTWAPPIRGQPPHGHRHASLFNRKLCRRVWMISDTFIIGDVYRYISHIRALGSRE